MGELLKYVSSVEEPAVKWLDSWKEIAAYLNRDVTTAQRWEKREGMPVHRHVHDKRGSVYAVSGELDVWISSRNARPEASVRRKTLELERRVELDERAKAETLTAAALVAKAKPRLWLALTVVLCVGLSAAASWLVLELLLRHHGVTSVEPRIQSLAVLPLLLPSPAMWC